jgi:pimeloyl-ACP methyl ester carboxylesterase
MAHAGTLHRYTPHLIAFEHTPKPSPPATPPPHTLLWIGGLGDGLLTVPYPTLLSTSLPAGWSLAEVLTSSSYRGWATSSLARDASELAKCVTYFRSLRPGGKVVLMGHSTGCQDIMAYLTAAGSSARPGIDGAVLQAGISDREALLLALPAGVYAKSVEVASAWAKEGRGGDVLPLSVTTKVFGAAVSAERWLSLTSPDKKGADDHFSSDLEDAQLRATFGSVGPKTPLCFLLGGADEHMPPHVDKEALLERWGRVVREGGGVVDEESGGVVKGASHNLDGDPEVVVRDLVGRVVGFLGKVENGELKDSAHL